MRRPPLTEVTSGCLVCQVSHSPLIHFIIDVHSLNSKLTPASPSRLPRSRSREVANSPPGGGTMKTTTPSAMHGSEPSPPRQASHGPGNNEPFPLLGIGAS